MQSLDLIFFTGIWQELGIKFIFFPATKNLNFRYSEMYSSHVGALVSLARHNPETLESVHMVTHPAYCDPTAVLPTITVQG